MYKVTIPVMCHTAAAHKEKTLALLKRGGADRVAIVILRTPEYGFSAEGDLRPLSELLSFFEANQLETMVWIGETLGHDRVSPSNTQHPYTNIRNMELGSLAAYCPFDEQFLSDMSEWIYKIATCGAKTILLDDDFRMGQGFGCCCPLHMAALSQELGEPVSEKDLKCLLLRGGRNRYRDAWLKIQGEGLKRFAKKLRETLDKFDPDIRLGACITQGRWDADGADPLEIAHILAGNTKPLLRTFGAPYHLQTINEMERTSMLGNIVEKQRTQLGWCEQDPSIEVFTEGDTYPRPRFACPASHLECFDTILRADGRSDGILKYMIDYTSSPEYETGYVDLSEKNQSLYQEISRLFDGKTAVGVRPYLAKNTVRDAYLDGSNLDTQYSVEALSFDECSAYTLINSASLPASYEEDSICIVFGESARHIPPHLLRHGAILDLVAANILTQRGIDVGLKEIVSMSESGFATERYLEENELVALQHDSFPKILIDNRARVLTKLYQNGNERDFVYQYENDRKQRFLVFPFIARKAADKIGCFTSYARKRLVEESIAWIGRKPLDAHILGDHPLLYLMVKKDSASLSVGLWNLFADKAEGVRIKLNIPWEGVRFVNCQGHKEGNDIVIDSAIYPFEFAGFELVTK